MRIDPVSSTTRRRLRQAENRFRNARNNAERANAWLDECRVEYEDAKAVVEQLEADHEQRHGGNG